MKKTEKFADKRGRQYILDFPSLNGKDLGMEYEKSMREVRENFSHLGWEEIFQNISINCKNLEQLLIAKSKAQNFGKGFNIDKEILIRNDIISACLSRISLPNKIPKNMEEKIKSLHQKCSREGEGDGFRKFLDRILLSEKEIPVKYLDRLRELMENYIAVKERYKRGDYL